MDQNLVVDQRWRRKAEAAWSMKSKGGGFSGTSDFGVNSNSSGNATGYGCWSSAPSFCSPSPM